MPRPISATICAAIFAATTAHAAETATYTYDVFGRLTQAQTTGGPSNGITRTYQYDATDNRTLFQLTGAAGGGAVTITPQGTVVNTTPIGVTLTVTVSGSSPTGMVTFTENGVFLGVAFLYQGQASVILEGFSEGTHTITATYSGDGSNAPFVQTFTVKVQNLGWLPAVLELLLSD